MIPTGSPSLVAQLAGALRLLERHCRANALGPPVELRRFVDGLAAQSGTERQTLDGAPAGGQGDEQCLLLTYQATAELLSLSERTVRSLVAAGDLPAVSIGRARRIHRKVLEEWAGRKVR